MRSQGFNWPCKRNMTALEVGLAQVMEILSTIESQDCMTARGEKRKMLMIKGMSGIEERGTSEKTDRSVSFLLKVAAHDLMEIRAG